MPNGYAKRTDANHAEFREEIKEVLPEATLLDLSGAGQGCPDFALGVTLGGRKQNFFFELKDGSKPESKRTLTTAQQKLHVSWQGQMDVVHSAAEAVAVILRNQ